VKKTNRKGRMNGVNRRAGTSKMGTNTTTPKRGPQPGIFVLRPGSPLSVPAGWSPLKRLSAVAASADPLPLPIPASRLFAVDKNGINDQKADSTASTPQVMNNDLPPTQLMKLIAAIRTVHKFEKVVDAVAFTIEV